MHTINTVRLTSVGVEADSGMEPLAGLKDVQGEGDLGAVRLELDIAKCVFQVQPERRLLQGRPTGRISLQTCHLSGDGREREQNNGIVELLLHIGRIYTHKH